MKYGKYEYYMERFRIIEWRDGCVYKTQSMGCDWFPGEKIEANRPADTNVIFAAANDAFARNNMTIRIAKGIQ